MNGCHFMKRVLAGATIACVIGLMSPVAGLAQDDQEPRPVVAVMDVLTQGLKISDGTRGMLTRYMGIKIAMGGVFEVAPYEEMHKVISDLKLKSAADCYDQACRIRLGQEMAASKNVNTTIWKLDSQCSVIVELLDLRKATAEHAVEVAGLKCGDADLKAGVEKAAERLSREYGQGRGTSGTYDLKVQVQEKPAAAPGTMTFVDVDGAAYIGLTKVRKPADKLELSPGMYMVTVDGYEFKRFSEAFEVKPGLLTTVKPLKAAPGSDDKAASQARFKSLPDWVMGKAERPDAVDEKLGEQLRGLGSARFINPLQGEIDAVSRAVVDLARQWETYRRARIKEDIAAGKTVEGTEASDEEQKVVDAASSITKVPELKVSILHPAAAFGDTMFAGVGMVREGRFDAESSDGAANVVKFSGARARCSAVLGGLVGDIFKMFVLRSGVSVKAMFKSYQANIGDVSAASTEEQLVSDTATVEFASNIARGGLNLNVKGMLKSHQENSVAAGKSTDIEFTSSDMDISAVLGGKPVKIVLTDGVISDVSGMDVCAATDGLIESVRAAGFDVEVKDLPDSPFGAALSRVRIIPR